jgi:carboxylate-amine ligase
VRYGLEGNMIDLGKEKEFPTRDLIHEMVDWFLGDVVDELGSRKEVEYALEILQGGTSADRQLAEFRRTGSLHSVVDLLVRETAEGVQGADGRWSGSRPRPCRPSTASPRASRIPGS